MGSSRGSTLDGLSIDDTTTAQVLEAMAVPQATHAPEIYAETATTGRDAPAVAELDAFADEHRVAQRAVEMDVSDQDSVDAAVATVLAAGHASTSWSAPPATWSRTDRGLQRGQGLLVWVGSTSTRGGTPPYLAPYFAAKAAEDSLAVSYSAEPARFGIETTIVVPGSFTTGTNHFAHAGHPRTRAWSRRTRPATPD